MRRSLFNESRKLLTDPLETTCSTPGVCYYCAEIEKSLTHSPTTNTTLQLTDIRWSRTVTYLLSGYCFYPCISTWSASSATHAHNAEPSKPQSHFWPKEHPENNMWLAQSKPGRLLWMLPRLLTPSLPWTHQTRPQALAFLFLSRIPLLTQLGIIYWQTVQHEVSYPGTKDGSSQVHHPI